MGLIMQGFHEPCHRCREERILMSTIKYKDLWPVCPGDSLNQVLGLICGREFQHSECREWYITSAPSCILAYRMYSDLKCIYVTPLKNIVFSDNKCNMCSWQENFKIQKIIFKEDIRSREKHCEPFGRTSCRFFFLVLCLTQMSISNSSYVWSRERESSVLVFSPDNFLKKSQK